MILYKNIKLKKKPEEIECKRTFQADLSSGSFKRIFQADLSSGSFKRIFHKYFQKITFFIIVFWAVLEKFEIVISTETSRK
jgi:hypothetical protein